MKREKTFSRNKSDKGLNITQRCYIGDKSLKSATTLKICLSRKESDGRSHATEKRVFTFRERESGVKGSKLWLNRERTEDFFQV